MSKKWISFLSIDGFCWLSSAGMFALGVMLGNPFLLLWLYFGFYFSDLIANDMKKWEV